MLDITNHPVHQTQLRVGSLLSFTTQVLLIATPCLVTGVCTRPGRCLFAADVKLHVLKMPGNHGETGEKKKRNGGELLSNTSAT